MGNVKQSQTSVYIRTQSQWLAQQALQKLSDLFPVSVGWLLGLIIISGLKQEISFRVLAVVVGVLCLTLIATLAKKSFPKIVDAPLSVVPGIVTEVIMCWPYGRWPTFELHICQAALLIIIGGIVLWPLFAVVLSWSLSHQEQ
jgi:uncharacterized membrane protein (Fun14 family)